MKLQKTKRIIALSLTAVLCVSSSLTVNAKTTYSTSRKDSMVGYFFDSNKDSVALRTTGQIDVPYKNKLPKSNDAKKDVKSLYVDNYSNTKQVADTIASYLTTAYGETSLQYALIDNGKIVLSGNAGSYSLTDNTKLNKDHMYGIGSVSKIYTAAAIMNLVEDGKINLDTPVTNYLKDFKMKDSRYKKITVRMLLNHSSGLMGTSSRNAMLFDDNDTFAHDNLLKSLSTQRLKADPGAYSVYCNDGFSLAELVVEAASGVDFTTYITNTFIKPLNLEDTATMLSNFDHKQLVKAYLPQTTNALPSESVTMIGAGGIYSSAEDLCTFSKTFMKDSNHILNADSLKAMENKEYKNGIWPNDKENTLGYGLGWDCVDTYPFSQYNIKALVKGGDSTSYHSSLIVLPEQNMSVAIVSSSGSSQYNEIAAQQLLLTALKEKGVISEIKPDKTFIAPVKTTVPNNLKEYSGTYISSDSLMNIEVTDNSLVLTNLQQPEYEKAQFVYTGDGKFSLNDGSGYLQFVKEKNGITYLRQFSYGNLPYIGQTVVDLYFAQKITKDKLSNEVMKAWQERTGKTYYILNEKYSSVNYLYGYPNSTIAFAKGSEEFLALNKITDENNAVAILDGPGSMSRDLSDISFFKKSNTEYLQSNGFLLVEDKAIKDLPSKSLFNLKIKKDGYAIWYTLGDNVKGKTIHVKVPKHAAFVVYDSNGNLINDSYLSKSYTVKLPKDGSIAFLGDPNSIFVVNYK